MGLTWVPEAYPPSGGLAATGFYKLLGRPRMDPLTVLVRETAQNSWDARSTDTGPVTYALEGRHLDPLAARTLREQVLVDAEKAIGTGPWDRMRRDDVDALLVCDRGTLGLGGPVRADEQDPDDVYDWVDFVLNVGKANTAPHTGGTYGFGKTISYVVSEVNTVVIHTRAARNGTLETRLIACAIGTEFSRAGTLHTGRHWWGVNVGGTPTPMTGWEADRVAADLGMPPFGPGQTGTNLMVVCPDWGGRTRVQARSFLSETTLWQLWPKMMVRDGMKPMEVTLRWDGADTPLPTLRDRPPLDAFADAYRLILDRTPEDDLPPQARRTTVRCERPIADTGVLVSMPFVQRTRPDIDDGHSADAPDGPPPAAAITGPSHHVALLRTPELIVQYLEGPPSPEAAIEWAAVFRAADGWDDSFRDSEPPTHDSWQPDLLSKGQGRTVVNVTLRNIRRELIERWGARPQVDDPTNISVAPVANMLGHLIPTLGGRGPGGCTPSAGGSPGRPRPSIAVLATGPVQTPNGPATAVTLRVRQTTGSTGTRLTLSAGAALDGATSDQGYDPELRLLRAELPSGPVQLSGLRASLVLAGITSSDLTVVVARGAGTSVLLNVDADPVVGTT